MCIGVNVIECFNEMFARDFIFAFVDFEYKRITVNTLVVGSISTRRHALFSLRGSGNKIKLGAENRHRTRIISKIRRCVDKGVIYHKVPFAYLVIFVIQRVQLFVLIVEISITFNNFIAKTILM